MSKLTGQELAEELTNFVNGYNEEREGEFIEAFSRQHRTLQQSSMRLLLKLVAKVGSEDYPTDLRNQQSKFVCQQMLKGFKKEVQANFIAEGTSPEKAVEYTKGEFALPHRYLGTI